MKNQSSAITIGLDLGDRRDVEMLARWIDSLDCCSLLPLWDQQPAAGCH